LLSFSLTCAALLICCSRPPLPTTTACRIRIAHLPGESSLPSLLYLKPILSYAIFLQQQVEPLSRSHV
jgi:hypothetical protein